MKGFVFSLQAVLILRQRQERLALEQYARALHAHAAACAALQQAEADLARAWDVFRTEMEVSCSSARASFHRSQCVALGDRRRRAQAEAQRAESAMQHTLGALAEARRQREAVDRLRDRRRLAFERDRTRAEGRILDDLAGRCVRPLLSGPARHPL